MRKNLWLISALVVLSGCDSDELRVSLVPKRSSRPTSAAADHNHAGAPGPSLHWTLPTGWSESPPQPGGMRYATLHAPTPQGQLDVSVFRFPGEAGGLLANVNRWRAELSLEPVTEDTLSTALSTVPGKGGVFSIDWTSPDMTRGLLAAIVNLPNETWFLKAAGAAPQLAACRDDFATLIGSFHVAAPGEAHDHGSPQQAPPAAPSAPALPSWRVPASWQAEAARPPRLASFTVGKASNFAVTRFPGDVGGALANLNRWRQQVGLPDLDQEPAREERVVDGESGRLIDLRGEVERMLICSVPHAGNTWFFKLRGPVGEVDDAEPEFAEFLDSLSWPVAAAPPPAQPEQPTQPPAPHASPPPAAAPALSWSVPEGWEQTAEAGRMRLATIRAGGAELAITRFPGDVGGLLQNVNRWRLQIGLAEVLRAEDQPMTPIQIDGLASTRVDLDGPERALRVVLIPRAGQTWFVKLVGSPADVKAEEARFAEFVGTLRFSEEAR